MMRSVLALLFCLVCAMAVAQDNTPPTVKLLLPKIAKPGAKVQAVIEITFAEGLHGYQNPPTDDYQIPVKVTVDSKGFILKKVNYPKGIMLSIGGDPKPTAVYDGVVKIPVTITVPSKAGASDVKVTVSYQQCNEQLCFPPAKVTAAATITVKK